jgi:hypothetical protein
MHKKPMLGIIVLLIGTIVPMNCNQIGSTNVFPQDLKIEGIAGGMHPWEENYTLLITAGGGGKYTKYIPGEVGAPPLEESEFKIGTPELRSIWNAIEQYNFFALEPDYIDENVTGGVFATLNIRAKGMTHRVNVQNVALPRFEAIIQVINEVTPPGNDLIYR